MLSIDNTKDIKEVYIEFPKYNLEMEYSDTLTKVRELVFGENHVKRETCLISKGYNIYVKLFFKIFII